MPIETSPSFASDHTHTGHIPHHRHGPRNLPGVGNLFKTRSRISNKSELLIFITPRVLGRTVSN